MLKTRTNSQLLTKSRLRKLGYCSAVMATTGLTSILSAQADVSCPMVTPERALTAHIPQKVSVMTDIGAMDREQTLPVMFSLQLNNEDELDQRIAEMYRPGSPTYHQFITPSEFVAKYAPTESQINEEKAMLEANGITVQSVSENHVFIRAQANTDTLNKVFKTEIRQYLHTDGKVYFAPANDLQIPSGSRISSVIGVSNLARLHKNVRRPSTSKKPTAVPEGGAPGGGLAPADIAKAYQIPSTATGAGQTLALFELDAYDASDIAAYEKEFKLPNVPLQNVYVDSASGQKPGEGSDEVTLDIEMMIALAPQADKILVYEGPESDASGEITSFEKGYIDVIQKIASDNLAQQISTSWGTSESEFSAADVKAEGVVYKQMTAQGQSFYAASGDSGAEDDGKTLSVDNPASQPYVIGVGGTTLKITSAGAWSSETTWNELAGQEGAGGGGISKVWTIPAWQATGVAQDKQGSTKMRNVPDVSLNADPETGYGIYTGGQWQVVGGTSASAPLWAAFNALVNQERAANKLTPSGFLAPAIYAVGEGNQYASSFYDITSGTNGTGTKSFSSGTGYDNATGWGSFKGTGLLQQLATDATP